MRSVKPWLVVAALALAFFWQHHAPPAPADHPPAVAATPGASLPPEVAATLALIARGGPYPYRQDGVVFGNYEHRLPLAPRGYYHEYTVPTPGAHNRGARRIITGGTPPTDYWYTPDHYRSFQQLTVLR
ncbi:MAG: ribonuclease [Rhodanobacter sp.]|nr:MAG: ribonuclease [Rhodanobacter sp.]TAM13620.1 MAG: ribonuclease [Rhodanobacter sp.]TAM35627.1 MAG: ribonuclease [Rhodanobacter sp.]